MKTNSWELETALAAETKRLPDLEVAYQEAALEALRLLENPDAQAAAREAREALAEAQETIARLRAAIPAAQRKEAAALAKAQAAVRAEQLKRLTKELTNLEKASQQYSVATENQVNSWRRLTRAATEIHALLWPELKAPVYGFVDALTPARLRHDCTLEIARLGLRHNLDPKRLYDPPGVKTADLPIWVQSNPASAPALPDSVKRFAADVLAVANGEPLVPAGRDVIKATSPAGGDGPAEMSRSAEPQEPRRDIAPPGMVTAQQAAVLINAERACHDAEMSLRDAAHARRLQGFDGIPVEIQRAVRLDQDEEKVRRAVKLAAAGEYDAASAILQEGT
jgi:hypothetical protein